jgi:hypothetical protein
MPVLFLTLVLSAVHPGTVLARAPVADGSSLGGEVGNREPTASHYELSPEKAGHVKMGEGPFGGDAKPGDFDNSPNKMQIQSIYIPMRPTTPGRSLALWQTLLEFLILTNWWWG